jgi:Protein of unknown function (DUF3592)
MAGIFFVDSIRLWLRRRAREKKLLAAQGWTTATGEVNHWQVVTADEDAASSGLDSQIEAGFHFTINGEYFGGYLRSVAMVRREAERAAKGAPAVHLRYDPANPDRVAVLAEDNGENLPFRVYSN